jgi:hypothetical protein
MLTLDSREPAVASDGTARTNIRQANAMRARMADLFGEERASEVFVQILAAQPFANRLDFIAALDLSEGEAAQLWPCMSDGNRVGLIDAWSCREDILLSVTSRDAAMAIIAARPLQEPSGPFWLAKALGRAGAAEYGAYLTSGSFQFRLDIVAIRNDGAGWARMDVSVDCSSGLPRVSQIRPMEALGWPFPASTPDQLRLADREIDVPAFLASGKR